MDFFSVAGWLIKAMLVTGGSFSAPFVAAAMPPLAPRGPHIEKQTFCEFELASHEGAAAGLEILSEKLARISTWKEKTAVLWPARFKASHALGFTGTVQTFSVWVTEGSARPLLYWVNVRSNSGQVRSFPLRAAPLTIWKKIESIGERVNFDVELEGEDLEQLQFGAFLRTGALGIKGYIAVGAGGRDELEIGIDVPCAEREDYVVDAVVSFILDDDGNVFCRVPVLKISE